MALVGLAALVAGLVGGLAGGAATAGSILAAFVLMIPLVVVVQRNHNRRRSSAEAVGAFGATGNVYFDNLHEVPRFRSIVGEFRLPWWTRLPSPMPKRDRGIIGGALWIDADGITWTPSPYRQRKGLPALHVPLADIARVSAHRVARVGPAGILGVHLRDGSEWVLSLQGADAAAAHLAALGCSTPD
jgi:hypothetical protein